MSLPSTEEQQMLHSNEEGHESLEQPREANVGSSSTPPLLPEPQVDNSFSIQSILDAATKHDDGDEKERLAKLKEENDRLDAQLKAMNDRLAAAEKRSEEIAAKRQSQMFR